MRERNDANERAIAAAPVLQQTVEQPGVLEATSGVGAHNQSRPFYLADGVRTEESVDHALFDQVVLTKRRGVDKRVLISLAIFLAILVFFLWRTRLPSVIDKFAKLDEPVTGGRGSFGQVLDPESMPFGLRWFAYGVNLWDGNAIGMFFALLLGGAALTTFSFMPADRLRRLLGRKGTAGAGIGGAVGMPLFMCSACSAPVSLGFYRAGAGLETSLGVIVGSALFQPVSILAIFLLMPPSMAVARVSFGLALLLLVVPLISRFQREKSCAIPEAGTACALPGLGAGGGQGSLSGTWPSGTWRRAVREAIPAYGRNVVDFAFRFGPPMLLASLAVGVVLNFASPDRLPLAASGLVMILIVAAVGTLLQVPGMFEIPLTLGLLALGLGRGPATALLLTLPSVGLVTMAITRRELGWRVPILMLVATFVGGVAGGVLVGAL